VISAVDQILLLASLPGTDHLVRTMHLLEDDVASILRTVDLALANLAPGDPVRDDLLEIRTAALLAVAKTEQLVATASSAPLLRTL
jgi:hypothetical protein